MDGHLDPEQSARWFNYYPAIGGDYGGNVQTYESSAADASCLWLKVVELEDLCGPRDGPTHDATIHLTADAAWQLADQLRHLVAHHHNGDATPEWAVGETTRRRGKCKNPGCDNDANENESYCSMECRRAVYPNWPDLSRPVGETT